MTEMPILNFCFRLSYLDVLYRAGSQPSSATDGPSCVSATFGRLQSAHSERHEIIPGQIEQGAV